MFVVSAGDGCLEGAPDTAEFSREFQKHQHLFDPEHDYPALAKWVSVQPDGRLCVCNMLQKMLVLFSFGSKNDKKKNTNI